MCGWGYAHAYIPNPLKIDVFENDSSLEELAEEILGLTKMNWNNTQIRRALTNYS